MFSLLKRSLALVALGAVFSCGHYTGEEVVEDSLPNIWPDYREVTVPLNIAPLNFTVEKTFSYLEAVVVGADGTVLKGSGKRVIRFSLRRWKQLLEKNAGNSLQITVNSCSFLLLRTVLGARGKYVFLMFSGIRKYFQQYGSV